MSFRTVLILLNAALIAGFLIFVGVRIVRLRYNKVGEKVGGPAPRGLDRFVLEVAGGNIVVDTGNLVLGPPIGTNTIDQSPEGPLCV